MHRFLKGWWRVSLVLLLLVFFATSCTVGCPFWTGDPLDGTVVDADSGQPIPGAVVAFTVKYRLFVPDRAFDLAEEHVTDSKGQFHIARWFLFGVGEPTWHEPTLIVHREGYATQVYKNQALGYGGIRAPFVRWKSSQLLALKASDDSIDAQIAEWAKVADRLAVLRSADSHYRCNDISRLSRTIHQWQELAKRVEKGPTPRVRASLLTDMLHPIQFYTADCGEKLSQLRRE